MPLRGRTLSQLLALLVLSMAAIGSAQNNDQPERSVVKQGTNEQQAVEQLRAIVEAIKRCPKAESPDKLGAYFYSAPQVIDWDVIPKQSARSDWLGYIEFIVRRDYVPNALPECKKKDSKCQWDNWEVNQMNSVLEGVNPLDEQRYEFDVGTHGLGFFRSMMKRQTDDETHWTGIASSPDKTCEGDAVTMVLNNRPPQIPDTLWQAAKNGEPEAEPTVKVRPPSAAPSSPAQPSASTESAPSAESITTLKEQAANGDADAQGYLGKLYYQGRGVPQDYTQAAAWFRKAAEQGSAPAQLMLGFMYSDGRGVPHNDAQVVLWWGKAAAQGLAMAQSQLGWLYANGHGVQQDDAQAAIWFRKAADQGDASAQFHLGLLYWHGSGVPQDYTEAYFWLDVAAAEKIEGLRQDDINGFRDDAAAHLTPADLSREQERARKWFEEHTAKPQ